MKRFNYKINHTISVMVVFLITRPAMAAGWGDRFKAWTSVFNDGTAAAIAFGVLFGTMLILAGLWIMYQAKRHQEGGMGKGIIAAIVGSGMSAISGIAAMNNETLLGAVS